MSTTAAQYDDIYRARLAAGHDGWTDPSTCAEVLAWLDELLGVAAVPRGVLLELGCGTGRLSAALAARGHVVVGVDVSALAVAAARRRPVQGRAEFHVMDARATLPRGQVDVVVDSLLLHCVPEPADRLAVLRSARRVLSVDGAMIVMTMCGDPRVIPPGCSFHRGRRTLRSGGRDRYHYAVPDRLPALFAAAGFRVVFSRVERPTPGTADQDMYLAVLRPAGGGIDG